MLVVLIKVLTIFLIVGIGFFANRKGLLPIESNQYFVVYLLEIGTPCMIVGSLASDTLSGDMAKTSIQVAVGTLAFFFVGWAIAHFIVKFMKCEPARDKGILMVTMLGINTGFMGFPITKAIFGGKFLFYMVIMNAMLGFFLYFIAIVMINSESEAKINWKEIGKSFLNICIVSTIVGLVILVTGVKLPWMVTDILDIIGDSVVPVSMIVVGIQLGNNNLIETIKNKGLVIASLVNVAVMPLLTFAAVNFLPFLSMEAKLTLTFGAAFPCAVSCVAIVTQEKKNADLMAQGVALTTLFSIVTLPLAAMFLTKYYLGG